MQSTPKVALLIETSYGVGREMLRGIAKYARLHGPWSFHFTPGDYEQVVPKMRLWGGTGIIARISNDRIAKAVLDAKLPTIAICLTDDQRRPENPLSKFSEVTSDAEDVARRAVNHFLERQLRTFAFVGLEDLAWSHRREQAFSACLAAEGFQPHIYRQPTRMIDRVWEREQPILTEWIRSLPKPVGLMACNDDRGREVLDACRLAGIRVPESVAVLGVDNDDAVCDLADPPLSSVALNAETAGYRAAELLDDLMQHRVTRPRRVLIESLGVVTRRSTEVIAVNDPDVAAALQFIRRNQGFGISVAQVAEEVAISRRSLEKRFRQVTGRTILEDMQLVRLERAKNLLLETAYPISKIARITGFGSTGYFVQFFRKQLGTTPRRFRTQLIA
jgi:LacI family transcriptional regulator